MGRVMGVAMSAVIGLGVVPGLGEPSWIAPRRCAPTFRGGLACSERKDGRCAPDSCFVGGVKGRRKGIAGLAHRQRPVSALPGSRSLASRRRPWRDSAPGADRPEGLAWLPL
jgi:hypothetical protein